MCIQAYFIVLQLPVEVVFASMFDDPPHLLRNTIYLLINHLNRHNLLFLNLLLLTLLLVAARGGVLCYMLLDL